MKNIIFLILYLSVVNMFSQTNRKLIKTPIPIEDSVMTNNTLKEYNTTKDEIKIYTIVEQMPEFPGGEIEMMNYLFKHWKIPEEQIPLLYRRSISARFYIDEEGNTKDIKVVRSTANNIVDSCFVEMIRNMPKWNPGKQDEKSVAVYYTIPMHFSLTGDR